MRVIGSCSPDDDAPADLASSDGAARTTWLSTTREFRYFPQQVKTAPSRDVRRELSLAEGLEWLGVTDRDFIRS